jgi:phosphomannomutase
LEQGLIEYVDLAPAYLHHIAELVELEHLRQAKLKVIVDPMYGAGAGYLKGLLSGGRLEVAEINGERNPIFPEIQPEPIAPNLVKLSTTVKQTGADVGLATDGDADRLGVVDEGGTPLTPLQIFALLALYLLEVRGERGAMVKTITTTSMLYKLGEIYHVPVYETAVGFKYVAPKMIAENALIGGEESSGYGFRGHIPERDGILAGLYFLDLMVKLNKTPQQLIDHLYSQVGPHYYHRIDLEFPAASRETIIHHLQSQAPVRLIDTEVISADTIDGFRYHLADGSWLLIRFSGTEPIMRIYSESNSMSRVNQLLEQGRNLAGI